MNAPGVFLGGLADGFAKLPNCKFTYNTDIEVHTPGAAVQKLSRRTEFTHFDGAFSYKQQEPSSGKLVEHICYDGMSYYRHMTEADTVYVGSDLTKLHLATAAAFGENPLFAPFRSLFSESDYRLFALPNITSTKFWMECTKGAVVKVDGGQITLTKEGVNDLVTTMTIPTGSMYPTSVSTLDKSSGRTIMEFRIEKYLEAQGPGGRLRIPSVLVETPGQGRVPDSGMYWKVKLDESSFQILSVKPPPEEFSIPRAAAKRLVDRDLGVEIKR
ncbi:hypothetical protein [Roseimicrobium sp. ORNL1]|uniref:hypothetical protein n=1 Tax=Roseimicrobium sp. ORNL1 TaxID=2711231 RepID=UPI00197CE22D|nr:hypothetical protein [Roseimicrobium sp. ORNL1]